MASRRVGRNRARRDGLGQRSPHGWPTFPRRGSCSSVAPVRHVTGDSSSSSARRSRRRTCAGSSSGRRTTSPTSTSTPVAMSSTRSSCSCAATALATRAARCAEVPSSARSPPISSPTRCGSRRIREDIDSRRTFSFCPAGSSSGEWLPRMRRGSSGTLSPGASRSTTTAAEPPTPRASRPQRASCARLQGSCRSTDLTLVGDDGVHVRFAGRDGRELRARPEEIAGPTVPASCGVEPSPQTQLVATLD